VHQLCLAVRPGRLEIFHISYPLIARQKCDELLKASGWKAASWYGDYSMVPHGSSTPRLIGFACRDS
jgi:hypothetical protein